MKNELFAYAVPSKKYELLDKLLHRKVRKLIRYSWMSPEETIRESRQHRRGFLADSEVFSLTSGSLYMEFDSEIAVGISSDPGISSVIVGLEFEGNTRSEDLLCNDPEGIAISADDPTYASPVFKAIIGQELIKYEVIKREMPNALHYGLPMEVALVFKFSNKSQFIASHGLHDDSDDFSVLQWEHVSKDVYRTLYKTSDFWS